MFYVKSIYRFEILIYVFILNIYIMIKRLIFLVTFLLLGIIVGAQEYFYYHQGEKVLLELDYSRVSINTSQNSYDYIKRKHNEITFSDIIESNKNNLLIDRNGVSPDLDDSFYFEISSTNIQTANEYFKFIKELNKESQTTNASPTFKTKIGEGLLGLSDKFYVKLKDHKDFQLLKDYADNLGLIIQGQHRYMPLWYTLRLPAKSEKTSLDFANQFYESGLFESTDPEFIFHNLQLSNDPLFDDQWFLKNTGQNGGIVGMDINAEAAWNVTKGSGIKVAIYDHGFEMDHPDLINNVYGTGFDAFNGTSPSVVRGFHGTPCAGIVGAEQDNNIGVSGVAPEADLISISINLSFGDTPAQIASGFIWAYQNDTDIISNSWGGYAPVNTITDAIQDALDYGRGGKGCIIVFASGNEDDLNPRYPGNYFDEILLVGAMSPCGERKSGLLTPLSCDGESWWGSCYGPKLDVMAPGVLMPTTAIGSSYYHIPGFNGTSSACPVVAGVAALILSVNPDLTGQEVVDIIERTARKVRTDLYAYAPTTGRPNGDWHEEMGYGLVDAYEAVMEAGILDLYMRNSDDDTGDEPDIVSPYFHDSPDVWIRNNDDNGITHQNAEYHPFNPNYVYVRVHNRGTIPSTVNDSLEAYWAKGSTTLQWDKHWNGSFFIGGVLMGNVIGKKQIPILQPGQSTILKFEWIPKNPNDYNGINPEPWHFCLAARINSEKDPMTFPETTEFAENVQNNNNIAWKNLTVVDVQPNKPIGGVVYAGNPYNFPKAYRFKLYTETLIYEEAEVKLTLDPVIYNAWIAGGGISTGIISTEEPNVVRVTEPIAMLENVMFDPNEYGTVNLTFNFLTEEYTGTPEYKYHLEQRHMDDDRLLGGEAYLINTYPRDLFYADAGGDKEANYNETILLNATDIGEDALYNWYDSDGNKVHQGKNYNVTIYDDTEFRLEVTATADGYKDYDNVTVSLRPNSIDKIYPNPATSTMVQVDYTINHGNNAYIRIVPVYGASGNGTNYPVNINENEIQIDISGYILGAYKVILYCDGDMVESKNLLIN